MARLLRPSKSPADEGRPGLVMIQIDGLGFRQFERAVKKGRLPFLARLNRQERYSFYRLYSGMPSSTPAVQGELFYGIKNLVPAFRFRHKEDGRIYTMYDPESATDIEKGMAEKGAGLLAGGSSYSNIFTGGAKESHYCASGLGWGSLIKIMNPLSLTLTVLLNLHIFLRATFLLVLEFGFATFDCIQGILMRKGYLEEIHFILARVSMCIFLRELVTLGAKIDIARGLPVIHLNFVGFDDQAHRRGPSSKFAHWSLPGIDRAIREIWGAAQLATHRDYDVWIYSDHGQEDTLPYPLTFGKHIDEAVREVYEKLTAKTEEAAPGLHLPRPRRPSYYGGEFSPSSRHQTVSFDPKKEDPLIVTAMGPLGHIYLPENLPPGFKEIFAKELVASAHIPLVMSLAADGRVQAYTDEGIFWLPEDAKKILGEDHPFLSETVTDLIELLRHPDSGPIVICGWRKGKKYISFPVESGAHGGPGPNETEGFALLALDASLSLGNREYIRPIHLREAAMNFLACGSYERCDIALTEKPVSLRLMTYNVHSCIGMDGRVSSERIARVIARHRPDVVALQELDIGRERTRAIDQAKVIAEKLKMNFHFHPAYSLEEEKYGDAILSRYPMHLIRAGALPRMRNTRYLEPRGAIWVEIELLGLKIQIINTHLSIWGRECLLQAQALLGPDWIGNATCQAPVILLGDFNAAPGSSIVKSIKTRLRDAQLHLEKHEPLKTWLGRYPLSRIDYVFVSPEIKIKSVEVPRTALERVASDHLPLLAEVAF